MKKQIFIGGKKCAFAEKKVKAMEERLGKSEGIFRSWRDRELYIFQDTALSALSRAENRVSPKYTASAPARSAAYADLSSPAGASSSAIYRPIVLAMSSLAAS